MTADVHQNMSEHKPRKLRLIVIGLAVIYLMTFMSGFLQDTQLNFLNYVSFFLLLVGGFVLIGVTVKSEATGMTKWVLFMTGISTTLLFLFFIGYDLLRLMGNGGVVDSLEALLYLTTLLFWILVIVSLVQIKRIKAPNSLQS